MNRAKIKTIIFILSYIAIILLFALTVCVVMPCQINQPDRAFKTVRDKPLLTTEQTSELVNTGRTAFFDGQSWIVLDGLPYCMKHA